MSFNNINVESWTVSTSIREGSSASMKVIGDTVNATSALLGEPYSIYAQVGTDTRKVYEGIVQDVSVNSRGLQKGGSYDVNLVARTAHFDKRPITTERFGNSTEGVAGDIILRKMFKTYGGLDIQHFDFTAAESTLFFGIIVQGDSTLESARQIAQVCGCELFTNNEGKLILMPFCTVDTVVFKQVQSNRLLAISKNISRVDVFSAIRVRGRYQSVEENAVQVWFTESRFKIISTPNVTSFYESYSTNSTQIEVAGTLWTATVEEVVGVPIPINVRLEEVNINGIAVFKFTKQNGSFPIGQLTVTLFGEGKRAWSVERNSMSLQVISNIKTRALRASESNYGVSASRRSFINWGWKSQKEVDAVEEARIDIVGMSGVSGPEGVIWHEIDNVYISTVEQAEQVGDRAFVEYRQSQTTFELDVVYDHVISLNRKVQFNDPTNNNAVVFGVITKLEITYTPNNSEIMAKVTVEKLIS